MNAMGDSSRRWAGLFLLVLVAISFAANTALAGLAYAAGSNALSVLTVRASTALLILFVLLRIQAVPTKLPRRRRLAALGTGLLLGLYSYGLLGSIEHVPIALGVITFYVYPIFTAMASWWLGRDRFTWVTAAALALAFLGLGLALGIGRQPLSPIGIGLALLAAATFTAVLLLGDHLRGPGDSRPVTLHMLASAVAAYLLACLLTGLFALPETRLGWIGFAGTPVFYTFSIIGLFVGVSLVGPIRSALVMNLEPVWSVVFGYLLLGQTLTPLQILGIGLVLTAILAVRIAPARRAPVVRGAAMSSRLPLGMIGAGLVLVALAVALHLWR
jgi:drug/metabolite transporter (DMT)-like permease